MQALCPTYSWQGSSCCCLAVLCVNLSSATNCDQKNSERQAVMLKESKLSKDGLRQQTGEYLQST